MNNLTLKQLRYFEALARHGHFGRAPEGDCFTWERTDKAEALKSAVTAGSVAGAG